MSYSYTLHRRAFAALLVLFALPCAVLAQDEATFVLTNGRIMTMDNRYPRAEALAVRGETIIAAGTVEDIQGLVGPDSVVLDAQGRLVVPGFNDSHSHFSGGARLLRSLNLYGVDSLERVLELVKEKVDRAQPGEWITGSRYDHTLWGEEWPTRFDLDKVAPDNPVRLGRASGHSVWVNSLALELSGITKDTENPAAGEVQKDPNTGEPTGILLETAASLVRSGGGRRGGGQGNTTPEQRRQRQKDDLVNGFRHAAQLGVTTVQTSSSTGEMDVVRELKEEGKLTLRWTGWYGLGSARRLAEQGLRTGQGDDWVRVGFLKGYIDGTLGEGTASMFEPFADRPDFYGLPRMTQEELSEAVLGHLLS